MKSQEYLDLESAVPLTVTINIIAGNLVVNRVSVENGINNSGAVFEENIEEFLKSSFFDTIIKPALAFKK